MPEKLPHSELTGEILEGQHTAKDQEHEGRPLSKRELFDRSMEILSTILLAIVAVTTAWSGYQSTRWDGLQSEQYVLASEARVNAAANYTEAGQQAIYDSILFNNWLNAHYNNQQDLANQFERRFRTEFRPAFNAWLATDPFNHSGAPPGPTFMPEYRLNARQNAELFDKEADKHYADGQAADIIGDRYVLITVFLASVLFFVALAQRFDWPKIQVTVLALAVVMLIYAFARMATFPIY